MGSNMMTDALEFCTCNGGFFNILIEDTIILVLDATGHCVEVAIGLLNMLSETKTSATLAAICVFNSNTSSLNDSTIVSSLIIVPTSRSYSMLSTSLTVCSSVDVIRGMCQA